MLFSHTLLLAALPSAGPKISVCYYYFLQIFLFRSIWMPEKPTQFGGFLVLGMSTCTHYMKRDEGAERDTDMNAVLVSATQGVTMLYTLSHET